MLIAAADVMAKPAKKVTATLKVTAQKPLVETTGPWWDSSTLPRGIAPAAIHGPGPPAAPRCASTSCIKQTRVLIVADPGGPPPPSRVTGPTPAPTGEGQPPAPPPGEGRPESATLLRHLDQLVVRRDEDPFKDVVAIIGPRGFQCTGVVVSPEWVLTARHCAPARLVAFGSRVGSPEIVLEVLEERTPPQKFVDAALLRIPRLPGFRPRPRRGEGDDAVPRGLVRLVGFGANDPLGERGAGEKRHADVFAFGWGCDPSRAQTFGCQPTLEMVLARWGDPDTCRGDSGGPVFERRHGSTLRLLAITSRALPRPGRPCGQGGVYTRVDRIASWLDRTVAERRR